MENAQKLHEEFIHLGSLRHKLKNRMLLILPEIYESGIWKKHAGSIIEYAGKYGDIAKSAVIKRLRLEKNLDDKPCLRAAIEKVGVHKVAMVVKIATPETDKLWAGKLENMSKMAVQSLSKEMRVHTAEADAPLCKAIHKVKKIELDEESNFLFLKLKSKLGKNDQSRFYLVIGGDFDSVWSRTKGGLHVREILGTGADGNGNPVELGPVLKAWVQHHGPDLKLKRQGFAADVLLCCHPELLPPKVRGRHALPEAIRQPLPAGCGDNG